jgi:hypothetical protein
MIVMLRSWLTPATGRPRPTRRIAQPLMEPLENRAVLSGSITANNGGLTPLVISFTLAQPKGSQFTQIDHKAF